MRVVVLLLLLAGCGPWNPDTGFLRPDKAGFVYQPHADQGTTTEVMPDPEGPGLVTIDKRDGLIVCPWWQTPENGECVSKKDAQADKEERTQRQEQHLKEVRERFPGAEIWLNGQRRQ